MSTQTTTAPPSARKLEVDFLYLDLSTCTRCRGTDRNLETALEQAGGLLAAAGAEVAVNRIHVTSEEQARELRFVSSPTLRVNGRDVALELRESSCGSEACTDGCGDHIDCRVWVHEGVEHTEPPVAMILDAILGEVYAGRVVQTQAPAAYELPENLSRFFAGASTAEAPASACCGPAEQESCCAAEEKASCCGEGGETCGCR